MITSIETSSTIIFSIDRHFELVDSPKAVVDGKRVGRAFATPDVMGKKSC